MTQATEELEQFFRYFFQDTDGWAYTPTSKGFGKATIWTPLMWHLPRQMHGMISHLLLNAAQPELNCYFSPVLFKTASPLKDQVLGSRTLWVDYDGNAPKSWAQQAPVDGSLWIPPPTLRVQSSVAGHEHCYWALDEFVTDVSWIEDRNAALAYATGADTSGWDANQVLRPIHTINRKPERKGAPVFILSWEQ